MTPNLDPILSRRGFLSSIHTGLTAIGLSQLLTRDISALSPAPSALSPHYAPKARRVLQIFCPGAASHIDLWEHKPELDKYHGNPMPGEENMVSFQGKNGNLMRSPLGVRAGGRRAAR